MTPIPSLDAVIAALYGGPLDGFVAARDALVKEVRAAGDRDLANRIKALRKPTVAADALNQALRQDPDALEHLLAAVERLRATQEAMLAGGAGSGEPADFAADQRAYRLAVEAVAAKAASNEIEVRAALEAAAIGGQADRLRAAAFATLPEPTGGFGPFAAGPGSIVAGRSATAGRAGDETVEVGFDPDDEPRSRGPSAAERRLAERVRRAAEQAVAAAEGELSGAEAAAVAAAERVAELDEELADLERRIGDVRSARDEAVATRAAAEAARTTVAGLLDDARAALDGLRAE